MWPKLATALAAEDTKVFDHCKISNSSSVEEGPSFITFHLLLHSLLLERHHSFDCILLAFFTEPSLPILCIPSLLKFAFTYASVHLLNYYYLLNTCSRHLG